LADERFGAHSGRSSVIAQAKCRSVALRLAAVYSTPRVVGVTQYNVGSII
jgi:hypothetical protein